MVETVTTETGLILASFAGAVERTLASKLEDFVNIRTLGAVGDGSTSDKSAFDAAFQLGGVVHLRPGDTYFCNDEGVTPSAPIIIEGNGATISDLRIGGSSASSISGVIFRNINFTTQKTPNDETLPPYSINTRNIDNIIIENCTFTNVMVYISTDDEEIHYGLTVRDCVFNMDGSNWAWETLQLDPLTIHGYRHSLIDNNRFFATNVNRIIKISVGLTVPQTPVGSPVPAHNARGITVRRNWIEATCDLIDDLPGGKQVIDCFSGTTESTFEDNYFLCSGFSRGIENKTGYAYSASNIVTAHKVLNNRFFLDFPAIFFQGAYGLTTYTPNSRDTLQLSGNTYRVSSDASGTVQVRFMHLLVIGPGEDATVSEAIADKVHYDLSSCESLKMSEATLLGGNILVGNSTSNAQSASFTAPVKVAHFTNVSVLGWGAGQTVDAAAITVKDCSSIDEISFLGCSSITGEDDADMLAAFWVRNCSTVRNITAAGNTANHSSNSAKELLRVTDTTVSGKFTEENNTWTPAIKILSDTATPSIKPVASGGGVTNGGSLFQIGGTTAITDFADGYVGQVITIYSTQNCTITNGTPLRLSGGGNYAMTLYDTLTLLKLNPSTWVELARSAN